MFLTGTEPSTVVLHLIPALGMQRQEDCWEIQRSLGLQSFNTSITKLSHKEANKQTNKQTNKPPGIKVET